MSQNKEAPKPHGNAEGRPTAEGNPSKGQTIPKQGERQEQVPRAPHERDESADSQERGDSFDRGLAQAGRKDVERGAVDTDKGPVIDETYQRVRESAPNPERKFRP